MAEHRRLLMVCQAPSRPMFHGQGRRGFLSAERHRPYGLEVRVWAAPARFAADSGGRFATYPDRLVSLPVPVDQDRLGLVTGTGAFVFDRRLPGACSWPRPQCTWVAPE